MKETIFIDTCCEQEIVKISKNKEIKEVLHFFDNEFSTPLSQKLNIDELSEKLARFSEFYVLKNKENFMGFVAFYSNDTNTKCAYLTLIAINHKYQKKGLGHKMLAFVFEQCQNKKMKELKLEVQNQNISAIEFYLRNGFVCEGKSSANSIYMKKQF